MNDLPDESAPAEKSAVTASAAGKTKLLQLDYKVTGLLCYLPIFGINLVASIAFVLTEPRKNKLLRFHAIQSIVLTGALFVLGLAVGISSAILGLIPIVQYLVLPIQLGWLLATLAYIGVCIYAMINVYRGNSIRLPWAGELAERLGEN